LNSALFAFTVREKARDPLHLAALVAGMVSVLSPGLAGWSERAAVFAATWPTWYGILAQVLALLLGTGLIGRDLANGALRGWAARPIRRSDIYVSRLFGSLVTLGLYLLIAALPAPLLSAGGVSWRQAIAAYVAGLLTGSGIIAALAALSLILQTYQDVAALLLMGAAASLGRRVLQQHRHPHLAHALRFTIHLLVPNGAFAGIALAGKGFELRAAVLFATGMALLVSIGASALTRMRLIRRTP
jgi:hypothetical protein